MKTVYLIRHGETLFNKQKKIQGFCDSPLTQLGIKQAQIAGKHAADLNINFDDAYSSTSGRTSDTLELITNIPYKRVKGLREWNFGDLEAEGEHLNPPLPYGDFFAQFGGEKESEFQKRIKTTIFNLVKESDGEHILIVSHGAAIAQFYRHWKSTSEVRRKGRIQNCSLLEYQFINNKFILQDIIEHDFSKN